MIPWSFSRLTDFETCPYRFQLKYIKKLPEAPNPAAERGTEIHKQYEDFILDKGPSPSPFFGPKLQYLLDTTTQHSVETQWAFTNDWTICDWFDDRTWVRIKPDLHIPLPNYDHAIVIDFKTGKQNLIKHTAQGQLYALGSYLTHPTKSVNVRFWYHDLKDEYNFTCTEAQILKLKTQWTQRAQKIETDHFPPKPTKGNCKYCGMAPHCGYKIQ